MKITFANLAHLCHADIVGQPDVSFSEIITDSRRLFVAERSAFLAIKGARHNGELYVADLYNRGLRSFIVSRSFDVTPFPDATFALVDDALAALQQIAAYHRSSASANVLAICGSNGKTIVKEWISQLVADDLRTVRSPRSYNSQVGVPISVLKIEDDTQLAIIETGISLPGEMAKLESIVRPDDVIFTNIGQAHQENFPSFESKIQEKVCMATRAKRVFFCADHKQLTAAIKDRCKNATLISWAKNEEADYKISTSTDAEGLHITVAHGSESHTFLSHLTDAMSDENLCHAIVYALSLGIDPQHIAERTPQISSVDMRLEQKEGHNGCLIIDDAYNADITSLEVALDMLYVMGNKKGLSRTLILSDLQQTGLPDALLYERVGRLLTEKKVSRLIGIGPRISAAMASRPNASFFDSTDDFLRRMSTADFHNEAILLKAQRQFSFEKITVMLECLRNRTVMDINMTALSHNIAYFRHLLKPDTKLLAMVKAFGYGTGSFEIAKLMQQQGVDYLGVAFADEGYDLREAGITIPIIVMNPEFHSFDLMLKYDLEPEIYGFEVLDAYSDAVRRAGVDSAGVHIKFNTGMTRSGFNVDEAQAVAERINQLGNIHVVSAFSHLVESEDASKDEGTRRQISMFRDAADALKRGIGYTFIRHILNSAGIERFTDSQFEMVRLGIGLYGLSAIDNSLLRNVATLKSYISLVRHVKASESVGYNRRTVLTRDSLIAIVPIGYADGVDRRLSNGVGRVLINGQFAPIVGNVCMDICMVDVTDVPNVRSGDAVEIFGDADPVWNMAQKIGTIGYEILTGIGRRVKRIYFVE